MVSRKRTLRGGRLLQRGHVAWSFVGATFGHLDLFAARLANGFRRHRLSRLCLGGTVVDLLPCTEEPVVARRSRALLYRGGSRTGESDRRWGEETCLHQENPLQSKILGD